MFQSNPVYITALKPHDLYTSEKRQRDKIDQSKQQTHILEWVGTTYLIRPGKKRLSCVHLDQYAAKRPHINAKVVGYT